MVRLCEFDGVCGRFGALEDDKIIYFSPACFRLLYFLCITHSIDGRNSVNSRDGTAYRLIRILAEYILLLGVTAQ